MKRVYPFIFVCLASFVLLCLLSMRHLGPTYDEKDNYKYGERVLNGDPERNNLMDNTKMPFNALNVLCSKAVTYAFAKEDPVRGGRYATVLAGLILAWYVFQWSYKLYGAVPALFSLFLFSFDPNIIAHARLVTTDIYAALMTTVSLYYLWNFFKFGGWKNALVAALVLGLSQTAKYTCLVFYPLGFFMGTLRYLLLCTDSYKNSEYGRIGLLTGRFLAYAAIFIAAGVLMINLSFGFARTGTSLKDYKFEGRLCRSLQSNALLSEVPVFLPYAYLKGLDMLELSNSKGLGYRNIYLLGHLKDKSKGDIKGFYGYYFFAWLLKTPLASQLIIAAALAHYYRRRRYYYFIRDEIFLVFPVLCFCIYVNFFFNIQIGVRYVLFCYPLLYVFAGSLFVNWHRFKTSAKALSAALLVYLAASTLSYAPHFISYFNEIVWDRRQAYKFLVDSNLDWGGEEWYKDRYIMEHPGTVYQPSKPVTGRVMVSTNELVGVYGPEKFEWLRKNYEPVGQVAYSYLIYNVR